MIAAGCIGLWLLRNALVFGNPLHTGYGAEYSAEVPSVFSLLIRNIWFYGNPLHNVLPILLILGFWGILREWRRQGLLLGGMIAGMALAMVWWVQGMRFVLPGIVIFLGFAAAGTVDLWQRWKSLRLLLILVAIATVVLQGSALCLYTYGQCNAWFDRTIGVIPADLHISSEGLYGIALARDYIDKTAPKGAAVLVQSINQQTWERGVFRSDLHIVPTIDEACTLTDHVYEIVQGENVANPIFTTASSPKTSVVLRSCK